MDDELNGRLVEAEAELSKLGLHLDQTHELPDGTAVIMLQVGDLAFTKRVQDPDAYADEHAFVSVEAQLETDTFLDTRERIRQSGSFFEI